MARVYRFPVVLWRHGAGLVTGRLLDEDDDGVAVGESRKDVLMQLKGYVQAYEKCFYAPIEPSFKKPKLRRVKVSV